MSDVPFSVPCPAMGKVKIAQTLARGGLHLGTTTVGRMLKGKPRHKPFTTEPKTDVAERIVTARYPNHVWHVDLTTVPTGGFWTSWLPFALPQCWPFAHWVAVVIDHFSRRVMGVTAFESQPSCREVCSFMGRTIAKAGRAPRHVVCDRGKQFDCDGFRRWCKRRGIKRPRYGAIGRHGSIAVVERVILTIKCLLRGLPFVPYRREAFVKELWQPSNGTTRFAHILGLAARRRMRSTSGSFPPIAGRDSKPGPDGQVVRHVPSPGRLFVAVPVRN